MAAGQFANVLFIIRRGYINNPPQRGKDGSWKHEGCYYRKKSPHYRFFVGED